MRLVQFRQKIFDFFESTWARLSGGQALRPSSRLRLNYGGQAGQAITEVLIGIAVGAILIAAAAFAMSAFITSSRINRNYQQATNTSFELMDNAKIHAAANWHNIYDLTKSSSTHYYLNIGVSPFVTVSGDETVVLGSLNLTRYFYVENVKRSAGGDIDPSGTDDPSTQKITVVVKLPNSTQDLVFSEYLTRSTSRAMSQSDWSGGWGQEGPVVIPNDKFATSTNAEVSLKSGSVTPLKYIKMSPGGFHVLATRSDNTVWAWGRNDSYGQLGNNSLVNSNVPIRVLGVGGSGFLSDISNVFGGANHSLALKTDGAVLSWGGNNSGQLGINSRAASYVPVRVLDSSGACCLGGVVKISTGHFTSFAIKSNGTLWAWGINNAGQIGDGTGGSIADDKLLPIQVKNSDGSCCLSNVIDVEGGQDHTLAITSDNAVWAWGEGIDGELGNGVFGGGSNLPVRVLDSSGACCLSNVISVSAGHDWSLALKSDGTVWAWGENTYGQVGDGTTLSRSLPVQVLGLNNVAAISAGQRSGYALKSDGTVWAWGNNTFGQIGNGATSTSVLSPQQVLGQGGVGFLNGISIVRGAGGSSDFAAALKDGVVLGWGRNAYGQFGDGTNEDKTTPSSAVLFPVVLTSSIFDTQTAKGAAFNNVMWQGDQPLGTSLQFQIASATSSAGPWNYIGPDGTGVTYYSPAGPNVPLKLNPEQHSNKRFVRYKIFFNTNVRVDDIILGWSP